MSTPATHGVMDQDGLAWLLEACVGRDRVAINGGFKLPNTRFVPLSVFAEVARGVAGDGWSAACVCVVCISLL